MSKTHAELVAAIGEGERRDAWTDHGEDVRLSVAVLAKNGLPGLAESLAMTWSRLLTAPRTPSPAVVETIEDIRAALVPAKHALRHDAESDVAKRIDAALAAVNKLAGRGAA